jgi:hypothetical protein
MNIPPTGALLLDDRDTEIDLSDAILFDLERLLRAVYPKVSLRIAKLQFSGPLINRCLT